MNELSELAFLGEEFMTWLWYRSETKQATFQLSDGSEVGITLDDFLAMDGHAEGTVQTLRHGLPTQTPEATIGLMAGKRLLRARLVIASGTDQWDMTFDGQRFAYGAVKTADGDPDEVEDARDMARMHSFVRVGDVIHELFRLYLLERLDPDFAQTTLTKMRDWVRAREL